VWNTCKVEAGASVAVFGLGAVGLSVIQAAQIAGARAIYAIDLNPAKFATAEEFGATDCIDASALPPATSIVQELQQRTGWGVDYTFDCTGSTAVMRSALEAAHRGWGVSCVIGVAGAGQEICTRPFQLVTGRSWKGTAFGGWKSRTHVPQLVRRVMSAELPISRYVTHKLEGVEATSDAIAALKAGDCLRAVVTYAQPEAATGGGAGFPAVGAAAAVRLLSEQRAFGGHQLRFAHDSEACGCEMTFSIFMPPDQAAATSRPLPDAGLPSVLWLSGLTCTDLNFVQKSGFQQTAAQLGLVVLCPDTSPRGTSLPGEHDSFSLGSGASFYVDATEAPWKAHYKMERYLTQELLPLAAESFGLDLGRVGISGHSMGGHGALTLCLRNPGRFKSVSALAPICAPTQSPWGRAAFEAYLGSVDAGKAHDATELVKGYAGTRLPILVDQGAADEFLRTELLPHVFERVCAQAGHPLTLRMHAGYDHSYLFVASFIADHLKHHARQLGAAPAPVP
jgi:S-formylglutathione hydrolase